MPTYRIQTRRDTYANWQNSSQVLLEGEIAINTTDATGAAIKFAAETNLGIAVLIQQQCLKIGDGINTWANLNFAFAPGENQMGGANNYAPLEGPTFSGLISLGVSGSTQDTLLANTRLVALKGYEASDNCTIGTGEDGAATNKDLAVRGNITAYDVAATNVTATSVTATTVTANNLAGNVLPFLLPTGTVLPFAGQTAPAGFKLCDGAALNTFTFKELHAVISGVYGGTSHSAGTTDQDGVSTTFNLPDLRGRVPAGSDFMNSGTAGVGSSGTSNLSTIGTALGSTGGTQTHTLGSTQVPAHSHFSVSTTTASANSTLSGSNNVVSRISGTSSNNRDYELHGVSTAATVGETTSFGGGGSHPNVQPTIVLNYMIKI